MGGRGRERVGGREGEGEGGGERWHLTASVGVPQY